MTSLSAMKVESSALTLSKFFWPRYKALANARLTKRRVEHGTGNGKRRSTRRCLLDRHSRSRNGLP
jgi:hypothetical protein